MPGVYFEGQIGNEKEEVRKGKMGTRKSTITLRNKFTQPLHAEGSHKPSVRRTRWLVIEDQTRRPNTKETALLVI